jgi:hypothetical protein
LFILFHSAGNFKWTQPLQCKRLNKTTVNKIGWFG